MVAVLAKDAVSHALQSQKNSPKQSHNPGA
jgi:hypothetical protein